MRVAAYARVSTADQHPENQLLAIRQYAAIRGWEIVREYVDYYSGAKFDRPQLQQLLADCQNPRRGFQAVVVLRLDRLGRSLEDLIYLLNFFKTHGIDFISINNSIDTSTPEGRLMYHIVGAFAEFERDLIRERVKEGQQRARAEGKHIGRPPAPDEKIKQILETKQQHPDWSIRKIAAEVGMSVGYVHKVLKNHGSKSAEITAET